MSRGMKLVHWPLTGGLLHFGTANACMFYLFFFSFHVRIICHVTIGASSDRLMPILTACFTRIKGVCARRGLGGEAAHPGPSLLYQM